MKPGTLVDVGAGNGCPHRRRCGWVEGPGPRAFVAPGLRRSGHQRLLAPHPPFQHRLGAKKPSEMSRRTPGRAAKAHGGTSEVMAATAGEPLSTCRHALSRRSSRDCWTGRASHLPIPDARRVLGPGSRCTCHDPVRGWARGATPHRSQDKARSPSRSRHLGAAALGGPVPCRRDRCALTASRPRVAKN